MGPHNSLLLLCWPVFLKYQSLLGPQMQLHDYLPKIKGDMFVLISLWVFISVLIMLVCCCWFTPYVSQPPGAWTGKDQFWEPQPREADGPNFLLKRTIQRRSHSHSITYWLFFLCNPWTLRWIFWDKACYRECCSHWLCWGMCMVNSVISGTWSCRYYLRV